MELEATRSRVKELIDQHSGRSYDTNVDKIPDDFILQLDRESVKINEEFSALGLLGREDLEECIEHVKKEIGSAQECNAKISNEINVLNETILGESVQLERDLEQFQTDLEYFTSRGLENSQDEATVRDFISEGYGNCQSDACRFDNFEILELLHLIEESSSTLSTLEDLDCEVQRVKLLKQIEDIISAVEVIEFDGNCIRLSVKTFVSKSESRLNQHWQEFLNAQSVVEHEILIELTDGTLHFQNVKIFPDDVFIKEVVDAAKLRRQSSLPPLLEMQLSLGWLIRKIQERIHLSSLRALVVKNANRSRHSFEYFDNDETITSHLVEGIKAVMKISHGWPASISPLKLVVLANSENDSVEVPSNVLYEVKELANSLDNQVRHDLVGFANAIEQILVKKKSVEQ
ncbi:hypothetical protein H6P81_011948 [Aristolochia fimbriata]|uniref:Uncharacterized protein n=1 Tax=Aristolochia fimbriata TaxID=158543 RepID=A0AAV7EAE4_ARIFI|nr:hypothetical protein H6P81_011948 [Aristolochia fimbriata]